jgi:hypothetical protein
MYISYLPSRFFSPSPYPLSPSLQPPAGGAIALATAAQPLLSSTVLSDCGTLR